MSIKFNFIYYQTLIKFYNCLVNTKMKKIVLYEQLNKQSMRMKIIKEKF